MEVNRQEHLLRDEQLLRVATDQSKVNKALRDYTIDARVGGDVNENNRFLKRAKERVQAAVIVFTTCAGKASVSPEWKSDEGERQGLGWVSSET